MAPGLSIVIPTWNGLDLLKRFLPSVKAAAARYTEESNVAVELLIVDDGSHDNTVEWLRERGFSERTGDRGESTGYNKQVSGDLEWMPASLSPVPCNQSPELVFVRNSSNLGFAEACNRGFAASRGPLVLLLNNDVEVNSDCIGPLVSRFSDPEVFAVHCRVIELETGRVCGTGKVGAFARGFLRVHQSYEPIADEKAASAVKPTSRAAPFYSMFAGGGSAMFDRQKFVGLGGFETLLSPFSWEDVELSYRAWKRGFTVLYEPRSVVRHRVSSTIRRLDRRRVRVIEQRNRLIHHWINLHDPLLLAWHLTWVLLLAVTAPLRLRPGFIWSCRGALGSLRRIRRRRREERRAANRRDREVLAVFEELRQRPDVRIYD